MRSKFVTILLAFVVFYSSFLFASVDTCSADGREIYVNVSHYGYSDGTAEKPYDSIQEALDVAENGDTIYIFGGLYQESLIINKKVKIVGGIDGMETIIDNRFDKRYLIEITADDVTLEGVTVSDSDESMTSPIGALICLNSDNNRIIRNFVNNTDSYGVYISSLSNSNFVSSNIINNTKDGYLTFIKARGEKPILGESHKLRINNFENRWTKHTSDKIDVAILPFDLILRHISNQGIQIFFKAIPYTLVPSDEKLRELDFFTVGRH